MANSYSDPGMAEPTYRGATGIARETDLIARIAEGDRKAFEELYYLYHRRLARFLTRLTRRYDIAEEVVNDTFWVVWRKAKTFRVDSRHRVSQGAKRVPLIGAPCREEPAGRVPATNG